MKGEGEGPHKVMCYTHIWSCDHLLYPYMVICESLLRVRVRLRVRLRFDKDMWWELGVIWVSDGCRIGVRWGPAVGNCERTCRSQASP